MSDLNRAIDTIRRRDWDKMRASWLDRTALVENISSDEGIATCDVINIREICKELNEQWHDAERHHRTALEKYDQECRLKYSKQLAKKRDLPKETEERARYDNNQTRLRFQKCNGKKCEVPGFPETLFCEALRLIHKAVHVLGCAEMDADCGMRSWSLSTGYHAGLFAGKGIIALCGIGFVEIEGKTLLADIFSEPVESPSDYDGIKFNFINYRLDHKDVWNVLQRILAITVCEIWPKDAIDKLKAVEEKLFARQRNELHYKSRHWPLPDLYEFLTEGPFGGIESWNIDGEDIDFEREDISLVVSLYLVKMALVLIRDFANHSNKFNAEIALFRNAATPERHPFYHELLSV